MTEIPLQRDCDIVVVDDDELTLELLRRAFRHCTGEVRYFNDELEAQAYLKVHKVRVLLVDQRMPRLDGIDLLLELQASGDSLPEQIFLCSACAPAMSVCEKAERIGATLLSKEVFRNRQELLALVA